MNEFDIKAAEWDLNPIHIDRAGVITKMIIDSLPLNKTMNALEYGAGTGLMSFLLQESLGEIIMMDSSMEMVRIMTEKISKSGVTNLKPLYFDLEKSDWEKEKFNFIVTQMVLHHVDDVEGLLIKFHKIMAEDGYLAIADLYPEDGSFHGSDFNGHRGFDPEVLSEFLKSIGFDNVSYRKCYVITKKISSGETKNFDLFLLIAN